jgi:hypothetical protein
MGQSLSAAAFVANSTRGTFSGSRGFTVSTAGDGAASETQSITHSGETTWTIPTSIGNVGLVTIRNLDATNYVQVGFATGVYALRIKAGQTALLLLEPATASLFLLANTAACIVELAAYEA